MPLVVAPLRRLPVGGGTAAGERSHYGNLFLILHVGFVLAAFAGFTLAAALAALYLAEERRLQHHSPDILRLRLPSLVVLEQLTVRTIAIGLPLLTIGLGAGFVRLREQGDGIDAAMAGAIVTLARVRRLPGRPRDRPPRRPSRALRVRDRDPDPRLPLGEPLLSLSLVGISHHVAPVELRERVALSLERAASLARGLGDAVCLSTCNRTEVYLADDDGVAGALLARGARRGAAPLRRLPACTTTRPPSTSSASPPASTP